MAFLDNLGKKVSEAGQQAVQITKDMADTGRLNAEIAEAEKAIDSLYREIGKKYVNRCRENPGSEFAELMQKVDTEQAKIRACRLQIGKIKGVQFCEACGAEVELGAAFCGECGAAMPEQPLPNGCVRCPHCNAAIKKGVRFCTQCGHAMPQRQEPEPVPEAEGAEMSVSASEPIQEAKPETRTAPQPAAESQPTPKQPVADSKSAFDISASASKAVQQAPASAFPGASQEPGRVCPACGASVEVGMRFCTECGHPMDGQPAVEPAPKPVSESETEYRTCPNCGARNDATLFFCTQCGNRL